MNLPWHKSLSIGSRVRIFRASLVAVLILVVSGCNGDQITDDSVAQDVRAASDVLRIDLGCIQRGGEVEFCIPLERFRIASHAEVRSIKSSCECVKVRKVLYRSRLAFEPSEGVLVSISPVVAPNEPPVSLRVQVEIESTKSEGCLLELDFLETDFVLSPQDAGF
jgi:hypothetical protein